MAKKIIKYCPNCGMEYPSDASFCSKCGRNLFLEEREKEKKRTNPIIIWSIVLLLLVGCVYLYKSFREAVYIENCKEFLSEVLDGWGIEEEVCNKISLVWYNSIFKVSDDETNQYTLNANGYFYSDFNDALYSYTTSAEYRLKAGKIDRSVSSASPSFQK